MVDNLSDILAIWIQHISKISPPMVDNLTLPGLGYFEHLVPGGGPSRPPSIKSLILIGQGRKWVHIIFMPTSFERIKNIP